MTLKEAEHKEGARERRRQDGSIFAYEIRYRAGGKYQSESFAVRKYGTQAKARDAAVKALQKARDDLHAGRWIDFSEGKVTLQDAFNDYLRSIRANGKPLAPRTVVWYQALWSAHVVHSEVATRTIGRIRKVDVRHLVEAMSKHFAARENREGTATINAVLRMLRAVFNQAERDERIPAGTNPAKDVRVPKPQPREARVLDRAEVDALAAAVPERYRALVLVLARCGLRIGEAAALRVGDVNELQRRLHVERSAGELLGHEWQEGPTKTGRARTVPIPRYVLDELLSHIQTFAGGPDALLFTGPDGGPLRAGNWRKRVWYPACERARTRGTLDPEKPIPHVHDTRHTAAILAMEDGVAPRVVQDILGHASYRVTMEIYARRASEELMDQAAEAMDSAHRSGAIKGEAR